MSQAVAGDSVLQKVPRLVELALTSVRREALELPRSALVASSSGDSLHAATRIEMDDRGALERLTRYLSRRPLAQGSCMLCQHGKVLRDLRRPWRDGTRGVRDRSNCRAPRARSSPLERKDVTVEALVQELADFTASPIGFDTERGAFTAHQATVGEVWRAALFGRR